MRAALVLSVVCVLVSGCATVSPRTPTAAATDETSERWPTPEEAAAWTVSSDDALRIARDALEDQDRRHMIYHFNPVVRAGKQFWRVTGSSVIAGGWETEIDARTGAVLRTRHLPGR
jgi:uncharacterized protein YceK